MSSGVYQITNTSNGNFYVGSSVNIYKRWKDHSRSLNRGNHHSDYLQNAWNKYGEENFKFEIIEEVLDKSKLIEREQYYLDTLKPEYNICPQAGKNTSGAAFYKNKEYQKRKNEAIKGFKQTTEARKKISASHIGNVNAKGSIRTEEQRKKMSENLKKRWQNKEYKQRLSNAHKGLFSGEKHPLYGKPVSNETREKIRQAHLGKKRKKMQ